MQFEFDAATLLTIVMVALRLGVVFYLTPLDAFGRSPKRISSLFIVVFSAVLVTSTDIQLGLETLNFINIGVVALVELINGLAMVVGVYVVFATFMIAGQMIDAQTGFAAAAVLNPATNSQDPLIGLMFQLLAMVLFFTMGMHHLFLEGIVLSYQLVPIGTLVNMNPWGEMAASFGLMFTFGVALAAPVLIGILMMDVGIAMMSRTMPQMNIYFVTLPLKIFTGLVLLVLSLRYSLPLIETLFNEIFHYWADLLR